MGEIYNKIKKLCKEKGVTISDVEKDLGFARGSLCKIDNHIPSIEKASKLSDYFEVDAKEFRPQPMTESSSKLYDLMFDVIDGMDKDISKIKEDLYYDEDTMKVANFLKRNKQYQILFDAIRNVPEDKIETTVEMINLLFRK